MKCNCPNCGCGKEILETAEGYAHKLEHLKFLTEKQKAQFFDWYGEDLIRVLREKKNANT